MRQCDGHVILSQHNTDTLRLLVDSRLWTPETLRRVRR
jgi:hypothetical protein